MTEPARPDPSSSPSPFVARWAARLSTGFPRGRRALDVAMGRGRNVPALVHAGFHVTGIDIQIDAIRDAMCTARASNLPLDAICADLTMFPLPPARFELIVVTRYLQRDLFDALREALVPGGVLLYETFTENQLRYDRGPRLRSHLLRPGELRMRLHGMQVLFDEEVTAPEAVARIAARRRA